MRTSSRQQDHEGGDHQLERLDRGRRQPRRDARRAYRRFGLGPDGTAQRRPGVVAREFDPGKVLDFIASDASARLFLVPAAMQIVLRHPRARQVDYSRMKYMVYGASPIPLDLLREASRCSAAVSRRCTA